ncbi:trafficking protein particle complex subunit 12 [Acrasis kona]|uniref:Trafficking protein particle complex subunit 12 n=1 Tax=Acrasis kona TaxID=1008807 RepID=A0AAW2YVZ7_9EUKA
MSDENLDESVSHHPLENRPRRSTAFRPHLGQRDSVQLFLHDKQFPVKTKITLSDVSLDEKGVRILAENQAWKEVLKICEKCLQLGSAPHELLQYRLSQTISLLRLHLHTFAQQNIDSLGDLNNNSVYFYEFYSNLYKQKKGNMVPFSLLLIKAVVPHFCGSDVQDDPNQPSSEDNKQTSGTNIALDRLYKLLQICGSNLKDGGALSNNRHHPPQEPIDEEQEAIWKVRQSRVILFIINCHISSKQYSLAIELLEKFTEKNSNFTETNPEQFIVLISMLGCLYLQCGMLPFAEKCFQRAQSTASAVANPHVNVTCRLRLNAGYLKFSMGRYADAIKDFEAVLQLDPFNVQAANNRGICYLYSKDLISAINSIEEFIRRDPTKTLDETIVYNLSTMYDLESENSAVKKKTIMTMIGRYCGDDFPTSAVKL